MLLAAPFLAAAQGSETADLLRSNGKIYVVLACMLVIFLGIIVYMIILDRKLVKLEKIRRMEERNNA